MEGASAGREEALGDRECKDANDEQSLQCNNNNSSEAASFSPHHTERPQALCEDTANKTVEFLRARLLAERAKSKAAKEDAENNAKRLMELERMLEVETEQRKKAEEAMQEVMETLRIVRLSSASEPAGSDRAGIEKHRREEEIEDLEDGRSSNSISFGAVEETNEFLEVNVNNSRLQKDGHPSASSVKSAEQRKEEAIDFANNNVKDDDHDQYKGFIQDQMSNKSENKDNGIVLSSPSLQNQEIHDQMSNQSETKDDGIVLSFPSLQNQEIYDQMSKQSKTKDNCIVLSTSSMLNLHIQDQMSNQSEIKDDGMVLSPPSLQNQGIQDQKPKLSDIKDNSIVLSSSLNNQGEHYTSADRGMSLSKDDLNEKCDAFQGPAPESFTDSSVAMHPRLVLEENISGLYDQMGNEVAPLAGQDQKKFLRLKLHELVDQIVCASEKEIHKYENSTVQTFNRSSKFPALESTCVQKIVNERNSRSSDFQPEIPCKGPDRVDSSEADKSSDRNSDFRIHNERAAAPSMDMIRCEMYENEYEHAIHCCGIRGNSCKFQHSDLFHTILPGKEDLHRHNLFQNGIPININQGQAPDMQSCLENKKEDELNCISFSEVDCTMRCSVGAATTTQNGLNHDHKKTMCFRRSCNHNQAAGCIELDHPLDLSRVLGSDGCNCMPRHHDWNSSHRTSYPTKCQSSASRFYHRKDILPSRVGPSSVRNCDNHNDMPDSNKNAGHTKSYSEYKFSPLLRMQWSSRGTPLDELPRFPRNKVGDALMALRNAKERIQSSIETTQNLRTYMGMSPPNGQNPRRQLVLR